MRPKGIVCSRFQCGSLQDISLKGPAIPAPYVAFCVGHGHPRCGRSARGRTRGQGENTGTGPVAESHPSHAPIQDGIHEVAGRCTGVLRPLGNGTIHRPIVTIRPVPVFPPLSWQFTATEKRRSQGQNRADVLRIRPKLKMRKILLSRVFLIHSHRLQ